MTVVYDFLATSHRLRAGPNAKTKDDRTDKLIYDIASAVWRYRRQICCKTLSKQNAIYMDKQNRLQESNLSEPDALSNCSTNDVLADLNHKLKIETESEMPKNRHGLKQSIKILGNGDNALYRLGDKMYLLEKRCTKANGYWLEFWCVTEKRVLQKKKTPRLNYITVQLYYRGQMIGLIRKIILAACDPNHDCTGDTKRETNLKNEMEIVRRMIFPWPDLTMFLTSRESTCLTARKNAGRDVWIRRWYGQISKHRSMCFADCKKLWLYDVWNCCIADWFYIWEKTCLSAEIFFSG